MRLRPRRKEVCNPEGETTSESRGSSPSSSPLPPGPTARWIWMCDPCRKSFIAWVMPAVDASGRERLYVWEYEHRDPKKGWREVEDECAPPCPECGNKSRSLGPAELGGDLQIAYDALKRLLRREQRWTQKEWLKRTQNFSNETLGRGAALENATQLFNHVPDCTCDECKDYRRERDRDVPDGT